MSVKEGDTGEFRHGLLLGAAYYPEHDPEAEWALDARLMRDAGLNCVRIGEFCWSRMQRADGTLTLDWVERCIEVLAGYGIRTILSTPTATPPVWLAERFPDLPCVCPDGRVGQFGGRRHYSVFHEGYRAACRTLAEGMAQRFGGHESVIGWQIDNEIGTYSAIDCSPPALKAYHGHLARTFRTVAELNRRWGLIFWDQEVERFDQVPAPTEMMCTRSPQHILDYNQFCINGMAEFVLEQAEAIRAHARRGQFVVGCAIEPAQREVFRLQAERGVRWVDEATVHNYPELLTLDGQAAMMLDRYRALAGNERYLALEHQTGSGYTTSGGMLHEVRRYWSFETLAHGARAVLWFHWRRFRTGCEWRHTSVVERDRRPRAVYESVRAIAGEMRRIEPLLAGSRVVADVQILLDPVNAIARDRSSEGLFWMEIQLPDGMAQRFPLWVREVLRAVYNPLIRLGRGVEFVGTADAWDTSRPMIAPDLDVCSDALASRLTRWCEAGGLLICLPGAGERDEWGAQRDACPPGVLAPLFGVTLAEYWPLGANGGSAFDHQAGRAQSVAGGVRDVRADVRVGDLCIACDVRHGEVLHLEGAAAMGVLADDPYAGRPVISSRCVGRGRAVYMGAVPAAVDGAMAFYRMILPPSSPVAWPCEHVRLQTHEGRHVFLLNGSPDAVELGRTVRDRITDRVIGRLPAWGVALVADA